MKISEVGEFGLIARLATLLGNDPHDSLVLGIGDDAAVWQTAGDRLVAATTDSLVEGVHFDLATTSWLDLGWKALAENLSDIAAMGCNPRYALIGLGIPAEAEVADAEALYAGLAECGRAFGCLVVGGDTVRSPLLIIHVTVLGESVPVRRGDRPLLTRSAAQPGDLIAVTGPLGASAAGLLLLRNETTADPQDETLLKSHRRPMPRVRAGIALVEVGVRCGIDVSDGLLADVGHICERSRVDAEVEATRVPVHPAARGRFGEAALGLALRGGEDYELVCVASRNTLAAASAAIVDLGEPPLTVIGSIMNMEGDRAAVHLVTPDGERMTEVDGGYQHFEPKV